VHRREHHSRHFHLHHQDQDLYKNKVVVSISMSTSVADPVLLCRIRPFGNGSACDPDPRQIKLPHFKNFLGRKL
jgi:hypothetical protein